VDGAAEVDGASAKAMAGHTGGDMLTPHAAAQLRNFPRLWLGRAHFRNQDRVCVCFDHIGLHERSERLSN
jgi:hypothetical protein